MGSTLTAHETHCLERLRAYDALVRVDDAAIAERGRWRERFAKPPARLILEIGCSDGALLARVAARQPEVGFVGLDWKYREVLRAAERIDAAGLSNVLLVRGRAQWLRRKFADGELDEVWLFHPDPCANAVERPNRLFAEPFLLDAAAVLRPGGTLTLKTDHAGYYQSARSLLGLPQPDWATAVPRARVRDLSSPDEWPARSDAATEAFKVSAASHDFWNDAAAQEHASAMLFAGERTAFEQKHFADRRPIFYVELRRR